MGVEHSAQHLSSLIHRISTMARVVSQHTLLDVAESPGLVENGCTLGLKSYPSSLKRKLRLTGPEIHGQTGLARSNIGSDPCVQYSLPDQGPEGAGS